MGNAMTQAITEVMTSAMTRVSKIKMCLFKNKEKWWEQKWYQQKMMPTKNDVIKKWCKKNDVYKNNTDGSSLQILSPSQAWALGLRLEAEAWLIPKDGSSLQILSSSSPSRHWARGQPGPSLRLDPSLKNNVNKKVESFEKDVKEKKEVFPFFFHEIWPNV